MFWRFGLSLLLLSVASATAGTPPVEVAFITARLETVDDVTGVQKNNQIYIDGEYRLTFKSVKILIGTGSPTEITWTMAGAKPVPGYDYYLLISKMPNEVSVIWSGITDDGVCVDEETTARYRIETAVKSLKQRFPCRY